MYALKKIPIHVFFLTGILALAFFLRITDIEHLPSSLWVDEAVNAADAFHANATGHYLLFYPDNYGREGLFINLQAFSLKFFGTSITALKLTSILTGTLTVLAMYLLAKELFMRRSAALMAAFITTSSYWAINFSRIGFRAVMTPLFLAFTFYFFFLGLRTKRFLPFLFSGLFLGLGLHTYIAFRIVPLIFIFLLPILMLSYEHFFLRYWKHGLVLFLGAFLAAAPMFYHFFVTHPEDFSNRVDAVSIFNPAVNQGHFFTLFAINLGKGLAKYNFIGDQNWRHNYPPYPVLDPIIGLFFLAGFLFVIGQTVSLLYQRFRFQHRDMRLVRNSFLLLAFFSMLLPEVLSDEGLPHALRSIGTQVPVFLFATLSLYWLYRYGERSLPLARYAFHGLIIVLLFGSLTTNVVKYFYLFRNSDNQKKSFTYVDRAISNYLLNLPADQPKYVATNDRSGTTSNGLPIDVQPIYFFTSNKIQNLTYLKPGSDVTIQPGSSIVMTYNDPGVLASIASRVPSATFETIYPEDSTDSFTVIHIP